MLWPDDSSTVFAPKLTLVPGLNSNALAAKPVSGVSACLAPVPSRVRSMICAGDFNAPSELAANRTRRGS